MLDEEEKEAAQLIMLFAMMAAAVVLVAVAVGMFFGAQWGVAFTALFAVAQFFATWRNVKKAREKETGGDGDQD